jgi:hypothetical protein
MIRSVLGWLEHTEKAARELHSQRYRWTPAVFFQTARAKVVVVESSLIKLRFSECEPPGRRAGGFFWVNS